MFKGLKFSEDEDSVIDYRIYIKMKGDAEYYYVEDCNENWDILNNLNNNSDCFIYLRQTDDDMIGIKVSEIVAFYREMWYD